MILSDETVGAIVIERENCRVKHKAIVTIALCFIATPDEKALQTQTSVEGREPQGYARADPLQDLTGR